MNTMINPQYLDVGAGISVGGGRVYITLDAGWPSGAYPLPTHATWTPDALTTPGSRFNTRFRTDHRDHARCRMGRSTTSSVSANP